MYQLYESTRECAQICCRKNGGPLKRRLVHYPVPCQTFFILKFNCIHVLGVPVPTYLVHTQQPVPCHTFFIGKINCTTSLVRTDTVLVLTSENRIMRDSYYSLSSYHTYVQITPYHNPVHSSTHNYHVTFKTLSVPRVKSILFYGTAFSVRGDKTISTYKPEPPTFLWYDISPDLMYTNLTLHPAQNRMLSRSHAAY
jgi:hypothetical protein